MNPFKPSAVLQLRPWREECYFLDHLAARAPYEHTSLRANRPFGTRGGELVSADAQTRLLLGSALGLERQGRADVFRILSAGVPGLVRVVPLPALPGSALICAAHADAPPAPRAVLQMLVACASGSGRHVRAGAQHQEIAFARNVSVHTVRTQVREILSKAGVRRQADLTRLIAAVPAMEDERSGQ